MPQTCRVGTVIDTVAAVVNVVASDTDTAVYSLPVYLLHVG